ncbi:MAG: ribbon-helix-helix domain-containing protein [Betaproteobacteria bacterium]|nr:ribbon-helix-helix domain-containing protein [Betaproteobacteria bacterium]
MTDPTLYRSDVPLSPCADDLTLFRSTHSISAKVWLPEPLDERLKELAEYQFANRSELLRDALFQHVYGSHRFEQMRSQKEGFFWSPPRINMPSFSRSGTAPYNLGKNIVNVRVWLPAKLRDDLALLAAKADKTWSYYVREALIFHFMGHRLLVETDAALAAARKQPEDGPVDDDGDA